MAIHHVMESGHRQRLHARPNPQMCEYFKIMENYAIETWNLHAQESRYKADVEYAKIIDSIEFETNYTPGARTALLVEKAATARLINTSGVQSHLPTSAFSIFSTPV